MLKLEKVVKCLVNEKEECIGNFCSIYDKCWKDNKVGEVKSDKLEK